MPIRAQVGSGDGVTNASMTPDTSSTTIMPSAMRDRRPALLGQGLRPRQRARVDDPPAEPQPGRRGEEHRRQLEHPVRQDQREELNAAGRGRSSVRRPTPRLTALLNSTSRVGRHSRTPKISASSGDQDVVRPHLRRERGRRVLRVVAAELRVDQLPDLSGRQQAGLHGGRPRDPPADDERDQQRRRPRCPATTSAPGRPSPGRTTTANRPTERHDGVCAPVTAERARATRVDSRAVSAGSYPELRTADRCVAVR